MNDINNRREMVGWYNDHLGLLLHRINDKQPARR